MRPSEVLALILFCTFIVVGSCDLVFGQCRNGVCYQTYPQGRVIRAWINNPDGTRTYTVGGPKEGEEKVAEKPSTGLMPGEINRDSRAYAHAKREAERLAASGNGGWHPLGTAPGCRFSGCGMSSNGQPRHCYANYPESRIVARAAVRRNGWTYWSSHYR